MNNDPRVLYNILSRGFEYYNKWADVFALIFAERNQDQFIVPEKRVTSFKSRGRKWHMS